MKEKEVVEAPTITRLVELDKINEHNAAKLYAKLEGDNPTGSAKYRIADYMIGQAEMRGDVQSETTLIEASSGNTGEAVATIAKLKGLNCIITVKPNISKIKRAKIEAQGATVVVCPNEEYPDKNYIDVAKAIADDIHNDGESAYYLNQNYNEDNWKAHYTTMGPEIREQSKGQVTSIIGPVGTGGTLSGTAKYLKEQNPGLRVIGVESSKSVVGLALRHYKETGEIMTDFPPREASMIDGLTKSFVTPNQLFDVIDEIVEVGDKEASLQARTLREVEEVLVGYSSGAIMEAYTQLLDQFTENDTVVLIFPDTGEKYTHNIYNEEWMEEQGFIGEQAE